MGAYRSNEMGREPLNWQDIESYCNAMGINLDCWEKSAIFKLSAVYLNQLVESSKANCPPPNKIVEQDPKKLMKHIKSILR